eukprot:TRINITY_DN258_c1_g1_i1.p1 TRINITY_DN258_c1_g1~~TRINITY_DN258_c1_g1_i1.p1  ORF type:complete len:173 (+),score=67.59 TRINITY_DN258_c1_g1_i1:48-566(+)
MYEMLMSEEHLKQHDHHKNQLEALDEMWKKRLEAVIEDNRSREEDLRVELERLRARCKQQKMEKERELEEFAIELKKFVTSSHYNGYTSVPLVLQKLEDMSHGLVDQVTDTPVGTSTPLPVLAASNVMNQKRSRDSDEPKAAQFTRKPALKRMLDMEEDEENAQEISRMRLS